MTAVRVHIDTFEYKDPRFGWYELFADETDLGSSDVEAYASHNAIFFADNYIHPNLNAGETWNYWVRAVFDNGDTPGDLRYLGAITLAGAGSGSGGVEQDDGTIPFVIDGGGDVITTGDKGYHRVTFDCTITEASLLADQTGSIQIDIWKCTYAQFDAGATHPVVGDSITASAKPTIAAATKSDDATLTGWNNSISAGDILAYHVVSVTSIKRCTVALAVTKP